MTVKIEACIFDMDGLLVDSESLTEDATNEVLKPYNKKITWELKTKMLGLPSTKCCEMIVEELNIPLSAQQFKLERQRVAEDVFRKVQPLPGALKLLKHLSDSKIPIAIGSGSNNTMFKIIKESLPQMFDFFKDENIVTCQHPKLDPSRCKPFPDTFEIAARTLGLDIDGPDGDKVRKSILVFEDGMPGLQAAKSGRMQGIWVPDPELLEKIGDNHGVDAVILKSLLDFVPQEWGLPPYEEEL